MGCLYKLTSPSGKHYIGITLKTAKQRWDKHVEHALGKRNNGALYAALRKYGPENFTLSVLVVCSDWETLCELEKRVIQAYNSLSPTGYNIALGGEGVQGRRSATDCLKISAAQRKRFQRPEERNRMRVLGSKGRASDKWVLAQASRRKPKNPPMSKLEWKRRLIASLSHPEVRKKISELRRKQWADPLIRPKLLAALANARASSKT